jgi:hypothetical protein
MKIGTFVKDGEKRLGAFDGDHVLDLAAAAPVPADMIGFI